jgi:hypothetical protein
MPQLLVECDGAAPLQKTLDIERSDVLNALPFHKTINDVSHSHLITQQRDPIYSTVTSSSTHLPQLQYQI